MPTIPLTSEQHRASTPAWKHALPTRSAQGTSS